MITEIRVYYGILRIQRVGVKFKDTFEEYLW
jgi:hypothetical protein